jgi:hypothetical protein
MLIVLFVLAAVAGIGVTAFQGLNTETHGATGAAMISRLDNAMRTEQVRQGAVGAPGFDTLVDTNGDIAAYLMGGGWSGRLSVLDLSGSANASSPDGTVSLPVSRVVTALQNAGITQVYPMVPSVAAVGADATFENTDPTEVDIDQANVALLTDEEGTDLNLDPSGIYVVFGLGEDCLLAGDGGVLSEAPVFMPRVGSAREVYANLMVIYRIPANGTNPVAQYVGTGMPMMSGLLSATHHLQVYHEGRDGE